MNNGFPRRRLSTWALTATAGLLVSVFGCDDDGVTVEVEEAPCSADGICLREMASGFKTPAHLASPPGDDRLMVVRTVGVIEIIHLDGSTGRFLDMVNLVKRGNEQGLLGLAWRARCRSRVTGTGSDGAPQPRVRRAPQWRADPLRA